MKTYERLFPAGILEEQPRHRKVMRLDCGKLRVLVRRPAIERLEVIDRKQDRVPDKDFQRQSRLLYRYTYSACLPRISSRVERIAGAEF